MQPIVFVHSDLHPSMEQLQIASSYRNCFRSHGNTPGQETSQTEALESDHKLETLFRPSPTFSGHIFAN